MASLFSRCRPTGKSTPRRAARGSTLERLEARYALDGAGGDPEGVFRLFLSEEGPGETIEIANPTVQVEVGESKTFYIWAQVPRGKAFLSSGVTVLSSTPGTLAPRSQQLFELDAPAARWNATSLRLRPAMPAAGDALATWGAFSLGRGLRLDALTEMFDSSYYAPLDAILLGSFSFTATNVGESSLHLGVNEMALGTADVYAQPIYLGSGDAPVLSNAIGSISQLPDATVIVGERIGEPPIDEPPVDSDPPVDPEPEPAAGDIRLFLSDHGPGEAIDVSNPTIHMELGQSKTLYVWAQVPRGKALIGGGLSIVSLDSSVIDAAGQSTFEVEGVGQRWHEPSLTFRPSFETSGEHLASWGMFSLSRGLRIDVLTEMFDSSYYQPLDAILFGTFTFTATSVGETKLHLGVNDMALGTYDVEYAPIHFGAGDEPVLNGVIGSISTLADATIVVGAAPRSAVTALAQRRRLSSAEVDRVMSVGGSAARRRIFEAASHHAPLRPRDRASR